MDAYVSVVVFVVVKLYKILKQYQQLKLLLLYSVNTAIKAADSPGTEEPYPYSDVEVEGHISAGHF